MMYSVHTSLRVFMFITVGPYTVEGFVTVAPGPVSLGLTPKARQAQAVARTLAA